MTQEGFLIEQLLMIADKITGEDQEFKLNSVQRQLDENLTGRDIVPKARQEGVSSYFLARYLMRCMAKRNTRAVVISHDQESTQRMLAKVKYFIRYIRGPAPIIQNMSANEITFPKMDSMYYIGTAGSRKFGRGDTITNLHCSEYAFWPNPKELIAGLFQAVPMSGEIAIESTGNGFNDYHTRCMRAYKGESYWALHFFNWQDFPEYSIELTKKEEAEVMSSLDPELEEDQLVGMLTPGQFAWRRMKLEEMDYDLMIFKQEYPMTLNECFQASGQSVFHRVRFEPVNEWIQEETHFWKLKNHPADGYHYSIGSDPSGGVGKDSSACEVICLETNEQVAEYANNKIDPEAFGHKIAEIGEMFNDAYQVVESNAHGILTVATLKDLYPYYLIHQSPQSMTRDDERKLFNLGYRTTSRNKPLMIGNTRRLLSDRDNPLVIHSPLLRNELSTFIEHEEGKMSAQKGCFDDTVMALACACTGLNPAALRARSEKRRAEGVHVYVPAAFSFDDMLDELGSKGRRYPVRSHLELDVN